MSESRIDHEFISKARHGLKNPLAIIREGIAIVQDETLGPVNDEQKTFLETAKRNVDRLLCMINEVFEYEELQLDCVDDAVVDCSLNESVKKAVAAIDDVLKKYSVTVECRYAENLPVIEGEERLMVSLITKLIVNAVQMIDEGTIRITTACSDDDVVLTIEDSGSGVADDYKATMFAPFSQNHKNQKTLPTGGLGLGLAIVEEIVMRLEGSYAVTTSELGGCCVRVAFPAEQ